jgi:signal transduction histidine kinase/CheY-like chemotaxis protein/HPt (histidine-containing phosphotransfer) domain-containing protein
MRHNKSHDSFAQSRHQDATIQTKKRAAILIAVTGLGILVLGLVFSIALAPAHFYALISALLIGVFLNVFAYMLLLSSLTSSQRTNILQNAPSTSIESTANSQILEVKRELERYREIEKQLTRAKKEAEAATMAKGEFLATMSHEIRTPLNGIIPLLDILLSTKLTEDQRDYLTTAYQSAQQLLSIVDDILDYSKIEANRLELESVGVNVKEIIDSVTRLMAKPAESKGLRLSAHIDPNVRLAMRGDPVRLRQILTNLVSNAIKFTEQGNVSIEVKKRTETRTHTEFLFSITDTGIGLSPEEQGRLFKPFAQADASTTRQYGGTGLGLVICKRIVDLMGGQIGVQSTAGKGSSFWVSVPLLKAVGDVEPARSELRGARLLLVSADLLFTQRLSGFVTHWGCKVSQTQIAADALAKLRSAANAGVTIQFDFLLIDLATLKNAAPSLIRNTLNDAALSQVRILTLGGEENPIAETAHHSRVHHVNRQLSESELHTQLQRLLDGPQAATNISEIQSLLPRHTQTSVSTTKKSPALAASSLTPQRHHNSAEPLVLLVEDNHVNLQVAQRLLSLIKVRFEAAENGKIALELLQKNTYTAVLMDCQMPIMDGYLATKAIRKAEASGERAGRIPIIAMTANAMAGDREKCLASGMDDYLSKPLSRAVLEQTLGKWIPLGVTQSITASPLSQAPSTTIISPAITTPKATDALLPTQTTSPQSDFAVNQTIIQDLRDIMGDEFKDLVHVYLEDTPKNLAQLERAAAQSNIDGMIAPAHSLKSTSANLGASKMSEMAKKIEHGSRVGQLSGEPLILVAELRSEFHRVSTELKQLLNS